MDFTFSLPKKPKREDVHSPKELEIWVPVEDKPGLNSREMNTILNEDAVINTMHIAIPSFLTHTESGELGYHPCFDLERYFIVATLKQSPYVVFYEEKKASPRIQKLFKEGFANDPSKYFLVDVFFTPFFGGLTPRYFLFQRAQLNSVPETVVLFRDLT